MNNKSQIYVACLSTSFDSTDTSSASGGAIDLANYFPVGRREVRFIVAGYNTSTVTATLEIQECATTATASFADCQLADGTTTTASYTITAGTTLAGITTMFAADVLVKQRYVRVIWTQAVSTDTGKYGGFMACCLPFARAV